jgi:solute carrier family 35 (adenosine 3'-phospho 5'-phosphosulfate transporter), member B2
VYNLDIRPVVPAYKYAAVSLSNVLATTCQYEALKYISFALQTIAKCAKMIPVMVWGTLILLKTYTATVCSPAPQES